MKADAHPRPASSLERAIALALHDPTTSVAVLENAWGVAYHWKGLFHNTFFQLGGSSFVLPSGTQAKRGRPAAPSSSHAIMKPLPVEWPDKGKP